MSSSIDLVGRLAQLHGIVSKPELNDTYVVVLSFITNKNRFSVRTLPAPNLNDMPVTISVKAEALQLYCQLNYFNKFPLSAEICVSSLQQIEGGQQNGMTVKLESVHEAPETEKKTDIFLSKSFRVVGTKEPWEYSYTPNPVTTVSSNVHIEPDTNGCIVEFEDILFDSDDGLVACTKDSYTTFRRCVFQDISVIVNGNEKSDTNEGRCGNPTAVFENCSFESGILEEESLGALVSNGGTATFLHCYFINRGSGAIVSFGGQVTLIHCHFESCSFGLEISNEATRVDMYNCGFVSCEESGLRVIRSGPVVMSGCAIDECLKVGIHIRGRTKHEDSVTLKESKVTFNRGGGICMEAGQLNVHIQNTIIQHNDHFGIAICPGVVGTVDVKHCNITENEHYDLINKSRPCLVVVEETEVGTNDTVYSAPDTLRQRRCFQHAGLYDIRCYSCGKKEEAGEKFKKCNKCYNACYCSRECQKAHWKEHKKVCASQKYMLI